MNTKDVKIGDLFVWSGQNKNNPLKWDLVECISFLHLDNIQHNEVIGVNLRVITFNDNISRSSSERIICQEGVVEAQDFDSLNLYFFKYNGTIEDFEEFCNLSAI